jgi:hypothetical protein
VSNSEGGGKFAMEATRTMIVCCTSRGSESSSVKLVKVISEVSTDKKSTLSTEGVQPVGARGKILSRFYEWKYDEDRC